MEDNVQPQKQRNDEMLEQTVESALVGKPTIESVDGYPNAGTGSYLTANDLPGKYTILENQN